MTITPTIAVVGSFALLVVAAVIFVVVLLRSRDRFDHDNGSRHHPVSAGRHAVARRVDTSLDGLDLEVSQDAPSASLLTPLRSSEWMPPETPAPVEALGSVSLDERIAEYQPAPDVPEPSFALDTHPAWEVAPLDATGSAVPNVPRVPEVRAEEVPASPLVIPESALESEEDFDAEIAALLPRDDDAVSELLRDQSTDESSVLPPTEGNDEGAYPHERVPMAVDPAPTMLVPAPTPASTPEPEPAPESMQTSVPAPEPVLAFEPLAVTAEPAYQPEYEPAAPAIPEAEQQPEPTYEPPAVAVVPSEEVDATLGSAALADDAYWSGLMAEQQLEAEAPVLDEPPVQEELPPSAESPGHSGAPRPVVRVTTAEPPPPEPPPEPVSRKAAVRPRATIRVHAFQEEAEIPPEHSVTLAPIQAGPRDAGIADLVLETPVEMWFGDSRIGVKPGSATYDKFRRYADALLADLNVSAQRADKV